MGRLIGNEQSSRCHQEGGFTLIEVMVAMAYLTVGLLAIAAMQDIALSRNVDARRLTVATNLAGEMIERIRYNTPANLIPLLGTPAAGPPFAYHGIVTCPIVPPAGLPLPCTATAGNAVLNLSAVNGNSTAIGDLAQWTAGFAALDSNNVPLLPNGVGTVVVAQMNPADISQRQPLLITVTVAWTAGLRNPAIVMNTIVAPL
jgi:prepilin-type N-terminal cleavage/methylation domain-containing protein